MEAGTQTRNGTPFQMEPGNRSRPHCASVSAKPSQDPPIHSRTSSKSDAKAKPSHAPPIHSRPRQGGLGWVRPLRGLGGEDPAQSSPQGKWVEGRNRRFLPSLKQEVPSVHRQIPTYGKGLTAEAAAESARPALSVGIAGPARGRPSSAWFRRCDSAAPETVARCAARCWE